MFTQKDVTKIKDLIGTEASREKIAEIIRLFYVGENDDDLYHINRIDTINLLLTVCENYKVDEIFSKMEQYEFELNFVSWVLTKNFDTALSNLWQYYVKKYPTFEEDYDKYLKDMPW